MSQTNHLFIIDPLRSLNIKMDTSLGLAAEFRKARQRVFVCYPDGVSFNSSQGEVHFLSQELWPHGEGIDRFSPIFSDFSLRKSSDFRSILMRKDPPFDSKYLALTYLLDQAVLKGVTVINHPETLRNWNEKFSIFNFSKWTLPTLVSSNVDELVDFMMTHKEEEAFVLKPLFLYGGQGVTKISPRQSNPSELKKQMATFLTDGHVMLQPFLPEIFQGELRCFGTSGSAISWCRKVPAKGEFIASSYRGAQFIKASPTETQIVLAKEVLSALHKAGASLVGLDIIGNYLSEINLTSPRLLRGHDDETNYEALVTERLLSETV